MTGPHPELNAELRQLATALLERLDPAVRMAAARASSGSAGTCQQVWCPVCAVAALVSGEQHPLLTVVAEHSVALLAMVRAVTETIEDTGDHQPDSSTPPPPGDEETPPGPGHYQHIPVSIDE